MTTFTFTISATFEADSHDDAWDEWTAWLSSPSNLENGTAILNGPDAESDAIWLGLSPAAKRSLGAGHATRRPRVPRLQRRGPD